MRLATPATSWELDRRNVARAILESQPGATALNLSQSLQFASQMQHGSGSLPGEIVYVGPGRISGARSEQYVDPQDSRAAGAGPSTTISTTPVCAVWGHDVRPPIPAHGDILVRARNYGKTPKLVNVTLNFGHIPQGSRP